MNTRNRHLLMLVAGTMAFQGGTPAIAQDSWVGEMVLTTKPTKEIKFGDVVHCKLVYFQLNDLASFKVRDDRDGSIRIHDGHREGWVDKADFVLARDAVAYFNRLVLANPNDTNALYHRGVGWLEKNEPNNAIKDFDECIRLDPTYKSAFIGRGIAWADKKDYDKAIRDYDETIRLDPACSLAFYDRGLAWANKKDYDKAIRDYDKAIRLDSKYAMAFYDRGLAWANKKDYDQAIRDCDEAIRLDPKFANVFNERAWIWATCPDPKYRDGKRAVEFAKQALELDKKDANHMDTLAAAYAEAGDFDEAVRWQERALADADFVRIHGDGARQRLELYRKKMPYRMKD